MSPILSLVAGGIAGGVEATITVSMTRTDLIYKTDCWHPKYPTEFLKTHSQLRSDGTTQGIFRTFQTITKTQGLGAIYTGCSTLVIVSFHSLSINCLLQIWANNCVQGTAFKASVRFMTFDAIKNALADSNGKLSPGSGIMAGMSAGCVESIIAVTPTERLKTALCVTCATPLSQFSY